MKQITIEEALGKRLERVWHDYNEIVLLFDDQTWVHGYADIEGVVFPSFGELDVRDMYRAGIITEEECQAALQERDAKWAKEREQREKREYERLKAKFEEKI